MKTLKNLISIVVLSLSIFASNAAFAQDDFNKVFSQLDPKSLQPLTDAFSSDINSGLFHSSKVSKKFSLYFGVQAVTTAIVEAPSSLMLTNVPFGIAQLTVGSLFGTDISLRALPKIALGKYGSVTAMGFSVRHSITQYLKNPPVDGALQIAFEKLNLSDAQNNKIANSGSIAINLQFSKEISIFTLYSGIQFEKTTIDYSFSYNGYPIGLTLENQNKVRGIFGLSVRLGPVNFNGDYDISKNSSVSAGFGFAF